MAKNNGNGRAGPLDPIPQHELDRLIAKAEEMEQVETLVHGNIGVISDDPDGVEAGEAKASDVVPHLPRYVTPRAKLGTSQVRAPMHPKMYCESCGHVGSHAHGCPVTRLEEHDVVNIAELAEEERANEPSIRRELKRIAAGFLKRFADRLEK